MSKAIILITIAAAFGCHRASTTDDVNAINRLQKQVDDAILAGDTERYVALLADDAVLMPPNAPSVPGRKNIRSWNKAMSRRFRIQNYAAVDDEVVVAGDWAFRRATFSWTITPIAGGNAIHDSGKFIIIYRRQPDVSWKVARDIWNSNTPAP